MGPQGGLARAPVRSHQCGSGGSPPGGGTNGPMCLQTLLRARCWEERRPTSFPQHLPWREERGTQSSLTRMLDIEMSVYRYTCSFGFIQAGMLSNTHTDTFRLLSLHGDCFHSLSLMWHARWNTLIKGICGSHLSIPYDLPAPVKVTYRLWCLRFDVLLTQSWPLRSDVLFKVVNDYHLSMWFSCRTGNPSLLHQKDCSCVCQGLDIVLTSTVPPNWHRMASH